MDEHADSIAIDDLPDLAAVVDDVLRTGEPCLLTRDGRTVARVVPEKRRPPSLHPPGWKPDVEAFKGLAGAWANLDIDVDKMIADIYRWRDESPFKPSIEL